MDSPYRQKLRARFEALRAGQVQRPSGRRCPRCCSPVLRLRNRHIQYPVPRYKWVRQPDAAAISSTSSLVAKSRAKAGFRVDLLVDLCMRFRSSQSSRWGGVEMDISLLIIIVNRNLIIFSGEHSPQNINLTYQKFWEKEEGETSWMARAIARNMSAALCLLILILRILKLPSGLSSIMSRTADGLE